MWKKRERHFASRRRTSRGRRTGVQATYSASTWRHFSKSSRPRASWSFREISMHRAAAKCFLCLRQNIKTTSRICTHHLLIRSCIEQGRFLSWWTDFFQHRHTQSPTCAWSAAFPTTALSSRQFLRRPEPRLRTRFLRVYSPGSSLRAGRNCLRLFCKGVPSTGYIEEKGHEINGHHLPRYPGTFAHGYSPRSRGEDVEPRTCVRYRRTSRTLRGCRRRSRRPPESTRHRQRGVPRPRTQRVGLHHWRSDDVRARRQGVREDNHRRGHRDLRGHYVLLPEVRGGGQDAANQAVPAILRSKGGAWHGHLTPPTTPGPTPRARAGRLAIWGYLLR